MIRDLLSRPDVSFGDISFVSIPKASKYTTMPTKKQQKQDHKLVAAEEDQGREARYIASTYKIPIKIVRAAMLDAGKNGKPSRSRKQIYDVLRKKYGYIIPTKKYS